MYGNTATEKAFALLTPPEEDNGYSSHKGLIPYDLFLEMLPLKNISRINVFTKWGLVEIDRAEIIKAARDRHQWIKTREEKDGVRVCVEVFMRKETRKKTMYSLSISDAQYEKDGKTYHAP
jgi:hypothetical protein